MLRDWLQLFRAQTAPASITMLVVPYLLSGADNPWTVLVLVLTATILHYASFGHNSLMDYLMGFDRDDPNKKHHPLPAGRIKPEEAAWVIHLLLFLSLSILALLAVVYQSTLSLFFLTLYMVWGYAYNNGLDHLSHHSWIPISLAFSFMPLYAYFLEGKNAITALLIWLWSFTTILYQIAFEGNVKDLWNPSDQAPNLLKDRCRVYQTTVECPRTQHFLFIRLFTIVLAPFLVYPFIRHTWEFCTIIILTGIVLFATVKGHLRLTRPVTRGRLLRTVSALEVLVFYHLLLLMFFVEPLIISALVIAEIPYFKLMNRYLWGTDYPNV